MARLSEEKLQQIRQSVNIVDVIGNYLPLEKRGKGYWAICPFHDDTRPSMSVSNELQIYKCFVCGAGGNVFTFLQNYLKIPYLEAVKMVAKMGGITVDELNDYHPEVKVDKKNQSLYDMHEEAKKVYQMLLHRRSGLMAKEYLTKRNLNDEIIEKFQIGFAPEGDVLKKAFIQMGFSQVDMVRSGLIIEGNQQHLYDRFKNRVIFPLTNKDGQVIGFSGRVFQKNSEEAKYINSPESDIFIKGETLYHYFEAKSEIRKQGFAYLLEGFMDVIAMYKANINNTLALMGTALTKEHLIMLKKITSVVYVCLDGDHAGQQATLKNATILDQAGFQVRIIKMKEGLDPDEVLEQFGKDILIKTLSMHMSFLEFKINYYYETRNMQNYDERKNYLDKLANDIALLDDPVDQSYYISMISNKSGFSQDVIHEKIASILTNKKSETDYSLPNYKNKPNTLNKFQKAEQSLLYYMLLDRNVAIQYEKKLGYMYNDTCRVLANYIIDYYRHHLVLEVADFIDILSQEHLKKAVLEILDLNLPDNIVGKEIDDYILTISLQAYQLEIQDYEMQLHQEIDPEKKAEVLMKIITLKKKLNELRGVV